MPDGARIGKPDETSGEISRVRGIGRASFSGEGFTLPAERRVTWIAPNRANLALGFGVWWRWDVLTGTLARTPRRG